MSNTLNECRCVRLVYMYTFNNGMCLRYADTVLNTEPRCTLVEVCRCAVHRCVDCAHSVAGRISLYCQDITPPVPHKEPAPHNRIALDHLNSTLVITIDIALPGIHTFVGINTCNHITFRN